MASKEQRAHDITISIVSKTLKEKSPNQTELFEIVKAYESIYKDVLRFFEDEF